MHVCPKHRLVELLKYVWSKNISNGLLWLLRHRCHHVERTMFWFIMLIYPSSNYKINCYIERGCAGESVRVSSHVLVHVHVSCILHLVHKSKIKRKRMRLFCSDLFVRSSFVLFSHYLTFTETIRSISKINVKRPV